MTTLWGFRAHTVAAALCAVLVVACSKTTPGGGGPQAMPAPVVNPTEKQVTLWDDYVGRFEAVDRVEVRPRVSGYIESVHFADGAMVAEGDLLFTIDQRPFKAAFDGASARVEAAKTGAKLAASELARAKRLLDARAGSKEEYDRRLQAKESADAEVAEAEAARRQASLDLEFTSVRAPISGRASKVLVTRGNLVVAQSALLTTIVSVDPIYFEFTGSENDYLNYSRLAQKGERKSSRDAPNPVKIKLEDQDDYTVEGEMSFVDNELNQSTGTILARAIVKNPDGFLTPGMFGRMRLYGRDPFTATLIPDAAVQFDQSRQFVWVVGTENKAEMRTVKLGRLVENDMRIVEDGVKTSDQIVVGNLLAMRPGLPLAPQTAPPAEKVAQGAGQ